MSTASLSYGAPFTTAPVRATARAAAGAVEDSRPAARTSPRLRLTRRGRVVFTTLAAIPLVIVAMLFVLNGGVATATSAGPAHPLQYVTVESGESLWQLAETVAPQADPRDVVADIAKLNQLDGSTINAGQRLAIPAQYSH